MYAILGEDDSDAEMLKVVIRRLSGQRSLEVYSKGYGGGGKLLAKGARDLRTFAKEGYQRFVISYDADGESPRKRHEEIRTKVVRPSGLKTGCCCIVPVQEIEAWIIADITAVQKVIPSWKPKPHEGAPEKIQKPKELLIRLSRATNAGPRYVHRVHNARVAQHLNLELVRERCPSFQPLHDFVVKGVSNCSPTGRSKKKRKGEVGL